MLKEAHFNPLVMLPERKESIYECGQSVIISQSLSPSLKNIENDIQETIEKWPKFMKPDYLEVTTQLPKSIEDRNIWKYYIEEKTMKILKKKLLSDRHMT